jgi:hypothetical protein
LARICRYSSAAAHRENGIYMAEQPDNPREPFFLHIVLLRRLFLFERKKSTDFGGGKKNPHSQKTNWKNRKP